MRSGGGAGGDGGGGGEKRIVRKGLGLEDGWGGWGVEALLKET